MVVRRIFFSLPYSTVTSTCFHLLASASTHLPQLTYVWLPKKSILLFNSTKLASEYVRRIFRPLSYSSLPSTLSHSLTSASNYPTSKLTCSPFLHGNSHQRSPKIPYTLICKHNLNVLSRTSTHVLPRTYFHVVAPTSIKLPIHRMFALYYHGELPSTSADASIHPPMCTWDFGLIPRTTCIHFRSTSKSFIWLFMTMENLHVRPQTSIYSHLQAKPTPISKNFHPLPFYFHNNCHSSSATSVDL